MMTFTYTLQNNQPMLFGTAGRLSEIANCYPDTTCTLEMGTRCANMSSPLSMMTMGVRKGDQVTVSVDGPSEVEMFDVLCHYFCDAM